MKHQLLSILCTATFATLAISCATQPEEPLAPRHEQTIQQAEQPSQADPLQHISRISARGESDAETRTVLDEGMTTILWTPEDAINIFYKDQNKRFVSINAEDASKTDFDCAEGSIDIDPEAGEYLWGLYPYDAEAKYSDGLVTTTLPAVQTATAGSFANDLFITIGRSYDTDIHFYNVCSGVKFSVDRDDVSEVIFKSNGGEPLAGTFTVVFDEDGKPAIKEVTEGASEIVLSAPEGKYLEAGKWYFIVTLPTTIEKGFTLTMMDGDTFRGTLSTTSALKFNRSTFRKAALTSSVYEYIDVDIENALARQYLDEADYYYENDFGLNGYTKSWFEGKSYSKSGYAAPAPVTFHWTRSMARKLSVSPNSDFSGATEYSVSSSNTSTEIYNLIPGKTYYWKTETSDGMELCNSTFVPVGPIRMIKASEGSNMRDLGGWTAENGKSIAYGKIYRGTELKNVSADGVMVKDLGIGVDIDLRGFGTGTASRAYGNWDYENFLVCQFMYYNGTQGYNAYLYQQALKYVINKLGEGKVIYFHCIGGADRTGTLAFLIEALLGVSEEDLSKDYELTNFYSKRLRNDTTLSGGDARPFRQLVFYLLGETDGEPTFAGETMQEKVTSWAKTQHSTSQAPLTDEEIGRLKKYMLTD